MSIMIFIKKSGSLFFNSHFLQAHLPAYVVPRKKKHTVMAVPNTCDAFLFANTGKKKNEMNARQNRLCAAALERNNLFINRCKASICTNVNRSRSLCDDRFQKKSKTCRIRKKRCLNTGQLISGFCNLFIPVRRNYFPAGKTSATFVSVQYMFCFDTPPILRNQDID